MQRSTAVRPISAVKAYREEIIRTFREEAVSPIDLISVAYRQAWFVCGVIYAAMCFTNSKLPTDCLLFSLALHKFITFVRHCDFADAGTTKPLTTGRDDSIIISILFCCVHKADVIATQPHQNFNKSLGHHVKRLSISGWPRIDLLADWLKPKKFPFLAAKWILSHSKCNH